MKQAIRALGWTIYIFWAILMFFIVTAAYSAFQFMPGFGEPYTSVSDGSLTVSLPFFINNGGLYDISNLQLATLVRDSQNTLISNSTTLVTRIPRSSNVSATHAIPISLSQMPAHTLSHLLFSDNDFGVEFGLKLDYANAVPIEISGNFSMPWRAPISNLTIGDVSLRPSNATYFRALTPVSFENHSPFALDGTMRLELADNMGHTIGHVTTALDVPLESSYSSTLELIVPASVTISEARLFFNTSAFSYGPVVIPIV